MLESLIPPAKEGGGSHSFEVQDNPQGYFLHPCQRLYLALVVASAAKVSEKAAAILMLKKSQNHFPRLQKIFWEGNYQGKDFIAAIKQDYCLDWEVVERDKQSKGFKVLPWRWKVERSFGCKTLSAAGY
jgi:hypothetical protein